MTSWNSELSGEQFEAYRTEMARRAAGLADDELVVLAEDLQAILALRHSIKARLKRPLEPRTFAPPSSPADDTWMLIEPDSVDLDAYGLDTYGLGGDPWAEPGQRP